MCFADTTYEFRQVEHDIDQRLNIATGTTKPDDPIFDNPYKAMNVGKARRLVLLRWKMEQQLPSTLRQ